MSDKIATYQTYRGLPALAGLANMAAAARPGLSVESCVGRLKRFHYAFKRLHEILNARITAEPIYELKTGFSHHAYLCAEHVMALRTRVGEMREPPLGLEEVPHPALEVFFDEVLAAPTTGELLAGIYEKTLPALDAALGTYMTYTNPLSDAPSLRVCRFARLELADMIAFGTKSIGCLVDTPAREGMQPWLTLLDECLAAAGGLDGASTVHEKTVARHYSVKPYVYDPVPKRDKRFQDLWNQGVNPEAFIYSPNYPARAKALMMLFKRLREIDVPEMMASIIHQTRDKPWAYYRDMSRQLWDEARHAMMGEAGFVALGVDWRKARITHNWSLRLNTECSPMERHAVLYFIEQGLMNRTGKRYEWELGVESGIPLMATIQDNRIVGNVMDGKWAGSGFTETDDGVLINDETGDTVSGNTISNVFDCGVETGGMIANATIIAMVMLTEKGASMIRAIVNTAIEARLKTNQLPMARICSRSFFS